MKGLRVRYGLLYEGDCLVKGVGNKIGKPRNFRGGVMHIGDADNGHAARVPCPHPSFAVFKDHAVAGACLEALRSEQENVWRGLALLNLAAKCIC